MNIIKREHKISICNLSKFCVSAGVPTPGGEPLSYDLATVLRFAQRKEPFVDTLGQLQELHQTKETINLS